MDSWMRAIGSRLLSSGEFQDLLKAVEAQSASDGGPAAAAQLLRLQVTQLHARCAAGAQASWHDVRA